MQERGFTIDVPTWSRVIEAQGASMWKVESLLKEMAESGFRHAQVGTPTPDALEARRRQALGHRMESSKRGSLYTRDGRWIQQLRCPRARKRRSCWCTPSRVRGRA